jgi:hypothetical protein
VIKSGNERRHQRQLALALRALDEMGVKQPPVINAELARHIILD